MQNRSVGRVLSSSGFRLQLVTLGNGLQILIITRDDFVRRDEVFLGKKILLEGCSSAGVRDCLMHDTFWVGELAGSDFMLPIHNFCMTALSDQIAAHFL